MDSGISSDANSGSIWDANQQPGAIQSDSTGARYSANGRVMSVWNACSQPKVRTNNELNGQVIIDKMVDLDKIATMVQPAISDSKRCLFEPPAAALIFGVLLLAVTQAVYAVPNPAPIENERIARATQNSQFIMRLEVTTVQVASVGKRQSDLQITADAKLLEVLKGENVYEAGESIRLSYSVDEATEVRAWKEYERKAKAGYTGPAPLARLMRVQLGQRILAYLVRAGDTSLMRPLRIEVEEHSEQQSVELGESVTLRRNEWAIVRLPDSEGNVELSFTGSAVAHCPSAIAGVSTAMCGFVTAQLLRDGVVSQFAVYPTSPPLALINGLSVTAVLKGSAAGDAVEFRVIGQRDWLDLWVSEEQDSFAHGCGGGFTGGYSRTEVFRDGRIVEMASPTFQPVNQTIVVTTGQHEIAAKIFTLLDATDFRAAGSRVPKSYDCSYTVNSGEASLTLYFGSHNPDDINAALAEAGKLLSNKDVRTVN